jgi:SAM-dependent methyltransferase
MKFPFLAKILNRTRSVPANVRLEDHFGKIYQENLFGGSESRSGTGSSLEQTAKIRKKLPAMLAGFGVTSILDAPCGDAHWIAELDWSKISYTGVDIVADLIRNNQSHFAGRPLTFRTANLCADDLGCADLILCRDCWVHLDYAHIRACLGNFQRSGARYLLTTTFTGRSGNKDLGGDIWRPLNLQAPPFSFPPPLELLIEECTEEGGAYADKALGLWSLQKLAF